MAEQKYVKVIPKEPTYIDSHLVEYYVRKMTKFDKEQRDHRLRCNRADVRRRIKCTTTGKVYDSITQAANDLGLDKAGISKCIAGKQHTVKGYQFKKEE